MSQRRLNRQRGNMLLLTVSVMAFVVLVGLLALNFSALTVFHKEVQSASDAAALELAKQVGRIVATHEEDHTYFGNVALMDILPADLNKRPAIGVNTLMATLRLDALIANRLGNTTMLVAAVEDLAKAKHDSAKLKTKIFAALDGAQVKDINGSKIDIRTTVEQVYDAHAIRLKQVARTAPLIFDAGGLSNGQGITNTPVPDANTINSNYTMNFSSGKVYKPYTQVTTTILGKDLNFSFIGLGAEPRLVEGFNFHSYRNEPGFLAPSIVHVKVKEEASLVGGPASDQQTEQQREQHRITFHATAMCGGFVQSFPSGTFQVSFPGIDTPPKNSKIDFATIKGIMNSSQITLKPGVDVNQAPATSDLGTASKYDAWNADSQGAWQQVVGGSLPTGSGHLDDDMGYRGRQTDNPSVVLSFLVWDWLRHAYLRPNIDDVVDKLTNQKLWTNSNIAHFDSKRGFTLPAYADVEPKYGVTFGLFNVPASGEGDPRDLRRFDEDPQAYMRQLANVFGYLPAAPTLPEGTLVISRNENGQVVTTNGESPQVLVDFFNAVSRTNALASDTMKCARAAAFKKVVEAMAANDKLEVLIKEIVRRGGHDSYQHTDTLPKPDGTRKVEFPVSLSSMSIDELNKKAINEQAMRDAALLKAKRAIDTMNNAAYAINFSLAVLNDRKTLSSLGMQEDGQTFELAVGTFHPLNLSASIDQILADGVVPTGQSGLTTTDWCVAAKDGVSQLVLISADKRAISHRRGNSVHGLLQPVLAATSIPAARANVTMFYIEGNAAADNGNGNSQVKTNSPVNSLFGVNVLNKQFLFQNTASLITKTSTPGLTELWNNVSRDNGALDYGGYWADTRDPGFNGTPQSSAFPPLIGEWTFRCPAPTGICPPNASVQYFSRDSKTIATNVTSNGLSNIHPSTDAAGNVLYYWGGPENVGDPNHLMHFYGPNDKDKYIAEQTKIYKSRYGSSPSQGTINDWIEDFNQFSHEPIFNISRLAAYAPYNQQEFQYIYSHPTAGIPEDIWKEKWSAAVPFFTNDVNGCPKLFRWSS